MERRGEESVSQIKISNNHNHHYDQNSNKIASNPFLKTKILGKAPFQIGNSNHKIQIRELFIQCPLFNKKDTHIIINHNKLVNFNLMENIKTASRNHTA